MLTGRVAKPSTVFQSPISREPSSELSVSIYPFSSGGFGSRRTNPSSEMGVGCSDDRFLVSLCSDPVSGLDQGSISDFSRLSPVSIREEERTII